MVNNLNQPRDYDAVRAGHSPAPMNGLVLGGIEGVKMRFQSFNIEQKIAAFSEAIEYGEEGLTLVIQALDDDSYQVKQAASLLLKEPTEAEIEPVSMEDETPSYGDVNQEVLARIQRIIADQIEVGEDEINLWTHLDRDLGVDSIDGIELIMALEEEFDIEISDRDARKIKTVEQVFNYIRNRVGITDY